MKSTALFVLATFLSVGPCTAAFPAQDHEFTREVPVSGPVLLEATTVAGGVTVTVGAAGRVTVTGSLHLRPNFGGMQVTAADLERLRKDPPVHAVGNVVTLAPIADERLRRAVAITFDVTVPYDTEVRVKTESGRISIRGLKGPVAAQSESGGVEVADVQGGVAATTGSGAIRVLGIGGDVSADSGSGDVDMDGLEGAVTAHTQSARIRARMRGAGAADVSSGSGTIEITGARGPLVARTESSTIHIDGVPGGDWGAESGSGKIAVRIPAGAAFSLEARSKSGRVRSGHPLEPGGVDEQRRVEGRVNGGGAKVALVTRSSAIAVE